MIISNGIIGSLSEGYGGTKALDFVEVPWSDAGKRRIRRNTIAGLDFALSMERSQYLFHGAVLFSDDSRVIAVSRPEEPALIIDLCQADQGMGNVRQAALIGHAFGNQHVPIEINETSIIVPMLSSEQLMLKTVHDLKLGEVGLRFSHVRLGASEPLCMTSHSHD